jgi:hypothetical protein
MASGFGLDTIYSISILVFMSIKDPEVLGFTPDRAGINLPPGYASWKAATEGGAVMLDNASDATVVLGAVRREGFFLAISGHEDDSQAGTTAH